MARIVTAIELLLVNRFIPSSSLPHIPFLGLSASIFLANFVFLLTWRMLIDPYYLSPLRNFPAPKVNIQIPRFVSGS
jgi:hypothetical protein